MRALPLLLAAAVSGVVQWGEFKMAPDRPVNYLTKFGCDVGVCEMHIKARTLQTYGKQRRKRSAPPASSITLRLFLDEEWEAWGQDSLLTCENKHRARITRTITVPLNATFGDPAKVYASQQVRPHIWYLALEDCSGTLSESITDAIGVNKSALHRLRIGWHAEMKQADGSHFSYEHKGTRKIAVFQLICFAALLTWYIRFIAIAYRNHAGVHYIMYGLMASVSLHFASTLIHLFNLQVTAWRGYPVYILDILGELFLFLSQTFIAGLLILLALGFSVDCPRPYPHEHVLVILASICVVNVVMIAIDHLFSVKRVKVRHFKGDGILAILTVLQRLFYAIGLWFCWWRTTSSPRVRPGVVQFYRRFLVPASLYFLTYPLMFVITKNFAPYLRSLAMNSGVFIIQLLCMAWLGSIFTTRGDYFKVSVMSRSILPGGFGFWATHTD